MDRSDITLERMRSFVRVAEKGSLSAVARELHVGQATITRHIQELERAVGVALLSRTTRSVTMTEEGQRYYADCLHILTLVEHAADEVLAKRASAAGKVRISCTAAFGVLHLTQLIFAFQDRYPHIDVDLSLNDKQIDLVSDGIDVAVRLAPLSDSSMKLRTLGQSQRIMVAAPRYLKEHGRPTLPQALAGHQAIRMSNVAGSDELNFRNQNGERCCVALSGRLVVDHGLAVRQALLAGRGVASTHHWLVNDLIEQQRLDVILQDYTLPSEQLSLLIAPARASLARVRLLVEFLVKEISGIAGIVSV